MKLYKFSLILAVLISSNIQAQFDSSAVSQKYKDIVHQIYNASQADSSAWEQLAFMCDTYGPRLSGSKGLEQAIDFIYQQMIYDGLQNVKKEDVMVPHWARGIEFCQMISPRNLKLQMLGLGGSVATPPEGISAELIVVKDFDELENRKNEIKGKIVLYNALFESYGQAVQYRWSGAVRAAKYGAVASLCRAVSPVGMHLPHTGSIMNYPDTVVKIPHAAISLEDAELIDRITKRGQKVVVELYMEARTLPDVLSHNILAELTGGEFPDEIIAIGGHIDSWDVGSGSHDDAGGCIAAWKALTLLKKLGLQPKRTIRAVMWTNEENGLKGGKEYAEKHKHENHILMFEFDSGIFSPSAFGIKGSDSVYHKAKSIEKVLREIADINVKKGAWGIDAAQLADMNDIPLMNINTNDEGKYFWYHHSHSDTPDKIDPKDLNDCIAAIAAMIYIYADLP